MKRKESRYKRDKKGNYYTFFRKDDIIGKFDLIDLLEELQEKLDKLISEINDKIPDDILILKNKKVEDTNNFISSFRSMLSRYDRFIDYELIYKGYQI